MIINTKSLPSRGELTPDIFEIEINPLTYRQLIKYTKYKYDNEVESLVNDIEYLITDIPNWQMLSAYDLSSILFTRKYISASTDTSIIVSSKDGSANYRLNISDISFKSLDPSLMSLKEVILNGEKYEFHIPTIYEYYDVLKIFKELYILKDDWISTSEIMILASLGCNRSNSDKLYNSLANATGNDIVTIKYLDVMLNDSVNDVTLKNTNSNGGETVVNISKFITDIFRLIFLNRDLDSKLLIFK